MLDGPCTRPTIASSRPRGPRGPQRRSRSELDNRRRCRLCGLTRSPISSTVGRSLYGTPYPSFGGVLGQNLIFFVFAAAVIGGVRLTGGRGTLFGALTGVLLLGIMQDILTLSQIPTFWITAAFGAIILAALCLAKLGSSSDS